MNILLPGGAGYIGSHTALALLEAGHQVVVADNCCNGSEEAVRRVEGLTGHSIPFYNIDVCDASALLEIMDKHHFDCVIHCAGLKAVAESVSKPVLYYRNNLDSTLTILECMRKTGVKSIVFSSSATVYGASDAIPFKEELPRGICTNPYGWTKSMIEQILEDAAAADPDLSVVLLRYFNPIGAHPSGRIGENPLGIPNNLMPYISQVAAGKRERLTIFGRDYPTPDGTCLRDYIHIMDLARGHVQAVQYAVAHRGSEIFNLGTGTPYSVLELVQTFERVNQVDVPFVFGPRRAGDSPRSWADVEKAKRVLGWTAAHTLEDMCRDSWNWQQQNPTGYPSPENTAT